MTAVGSRSTPDHAGDPNLLEGLLGSVSCVLSSCGWYEFPPGWTTPERALENHVAYLCVDGELAADLDGNRRVVTRGEVLLTPLGVRHRLANRSHQALRLLTVHFVARIHDLLDMPSIYGLPIQLRPSAAGMAMMEGVVRQMIDELDARSPGSALAANADCAHLVALLWRETVEQFGGQLSVVSPRARDLVRLEPVFRLIHERYAERPTLAQLARVVHLEPDYFATVFKRVTGTPPLKYVAAYRLREVRTLLAATDEPIRVIAARTGYADSFYLSRAFSRAYGVTPSAYRKSRNNPDLP
jgi:AraC-like DNA-binding protein